MTLKIITDSACDLPEEIVEKYDIDVLPFLVYLDDKEYKDGVDITPKQVYDAIRSGSVPSTGQVPIDKIIATFKKYAEQKRPCLYISFSSKLSGTCNTARLVSQELKKAYQDFQITIIDSQSGSLGQGLIVLEAAQMAAKGKNPSLIIERTQLRSLNNMEHIFSVDDLDYLYRGGRVGHASAFLGGLLKVKPILHFQDGLMIPFQKARGKQMAIKRIVDLVKDRSLGDRKQIVGISHADDPSMAEQLQSLLTQELGYHSYIVNLVGSVLACHIGIGGVAAFFVNSTTTEAKFGSSSLTLSTH